MTLDLQTWLALGFQAACFYVIPMVAAVLLVRRFGTPWGRLGLGAVTWLCALPFIVAGPFAAVALVGGEDPTKAAIAAGAGLSVAAGISEETSRWLWYRWARLPDRRSAMVAGLGHGTTEAWVLGLQFVVGQIVLITTMPEMLPAEARDPHVLAQWAWIGGASRLLFVVAHVGLTLIVWSGVRQRSVRGWLLAMGLHIALDLAAFVLPHLVPGADAAVFAIAVPLALWAGWSVLQELRFGPRAG